MLSNPDGADGGCIFIGGIQLDRNKRRSNPSRRGDADTNWMGLTLENLQLREHFRLEKAGRQAD
jgi:hypothetical protein